VLARLCCVSEQEFESVFDDIVDCAQDAGESFSVRNTLGEIYRSWKANRRKLTEPDGKMTHPDLGIGTRLFVSLSSIPCFRQIAIRTMRNYAWNTAQIRKNLRPLK
jgi:hypothetical protein